MNINGRLDRTATNSVAVTDVQRLVCNEPIQWIDTGYEPSISQLLRRLYEIETKLDQLEAKLKLVAPYIPEDIDVGELL